MSKKSVGKNKQQPSLKPQIVDQQNDPFLRAMQKKIRNINKKLTQISELEHKDNLKPEQVEKINRKDHLLEEKAKFEELSNTFKDVCKENAEHYRELQLKELENLATAVTIYHAVPQFPEHHKLNRLWNGLTNVNGGNLSQAIISLTKLLRDISGDKKLQQAIATFVNDNKQLEVSKEERVQPQISVKKEEQEKKEKEQSKKVEPKIEVHTNEIIILREQLKNEKGQPEHIEVIERIHDGVVEDISVEILNEKKPVQPTPQPRTTEEPPKEQPKIEENQPQKGEKEEERPKTKKYDRPYRGKDNYREQRGEYRQNRGDRRNPYYERKEGEEKRNYKPKFQQKQENREKEQRKVNQEVKEKPEDDNSSSENEQQSRKFKRQEIKELEDQGFIVVGKPKPKARDQMNVYSYQHGRQKGHHNLPHH